jgi:hypothetical protein
MNPAMQTKRKMNGKVQVKTAVPPIDFGPKATAMKQITQVTQTALKSPPANLKSS